MTDILYTWIDIQAELEEKIPVWPGSLYSARAYWDALTIEHESGQRDAVDSWLAEHFGPRWVGTHEERWIRLDSLPNGPPRVLPVSFEGVAEPAPRGVARRTFHRPDTALRRNTPPPPAPVLLPKVFAWHSFKGGSGRTTTALQFAKLLGTRAGASVMLVDMDFEAPGITWMTAESRLPTPRIAMSDVLALVHGTPPSELDATFDLIAHALRDSMVDGFVILPAIRSGQREADVRPEHLEAPDLPPLADVLSRIAAKLEITHVVADLRAGRSELAASLLLDPRVARVLVTTSAGQALKGTAQMIADLKGTLPSAPTDPAITVVASRLVAPATQAFTEVRDTLSRATEDILPEGNEDAPFPVRFTAALHDESLLSLPLDWNAATSRLDATTVLDVKGLPVDFTFAQWAEEACPATSANAAPGPVGIDESRRQLSAFAEPLVRAEGSDHGEYLDAQFLRRLIQAHRSRLPIAVAIGAKGSGKTFTFLRMAGHGTWKAFAAAAEQFADIDGRVVPVIWSRTLQPSAVALIERGLSRSIDAATVEVTDILDSARQSRELASQWRDWWIELLVRRGGFDTIEALTRPNREAAPPLFIVDGLEDLLPKVHSDPVEQMCLRALLQDVPSWLKASGSPAGLVVFTRSDYVRAAIPQNTEHFRQLYRAYELYWDRAEALRLVRWTATKAGVLAASPDETEALARVWGRKIGDDTSRESATDVWVMDALGTRKEDVQARDLVRLIAKAAELSVGKGWEDRLLAPQAIRDALQPVGEAKIDEIIEEFPELGGALARFRQLKATVRIPFRFADLREDLDRAALSQLENAGIAWRDDAQEIWLVSLYRRGLGMQLQPRRRERVLR